MSQELTVIDNRAVYRSISVGNVICRL